MPDFNPSAAGLPQLQAPENPLNIAGNIASQQSQNQLRDLQSQGAAQDIQSKARNMQLSMLSGVLNESDPEKQRDLISRLVPIANKINPSYQIDSSIGVPEIRALLQSQKPIENIPDTAFLGSQTGQALSPLIKEGLQSGQLNLKDVVSAQAANPFLNVGGMSAPNAANAVFGGEQQPAYLQALSQLPQSMQPTVKAIIEGRETPPNPNSRSPGAQALMQAVNAVDPSFDAVNYNARANTRKSFTSGADATNITALNTAIPHLVSLKQAYDKLDNGTGNKALNAVENFAATSINPFSESRAKNQAALADVQEKNTAVSHELAKVFRSSGMSEAEIADWENKFSANNTPAQSNQLIQGALDLLEGRLQALGDKYNQGMGTTKQPLELLSPSSQAAFQKLRGNIPLSAAEQAQGKLKQPETNGGTNASSQGTPIIKTQADFDALPSGAVYVEPDGKKYRKP